MRFGRNVIRFEVFAGLVALSLLGSACGDDDGQCTCPADEVINCAHRGTGINTSESDYPENTLPAFEQGVILGADMVELDVQHTSDGQLVVMHDDTVDRTTDATGCVADYSLSEIQELDAAWGTPLEGTGVTVPTLADVFDAVDVPVNVEIKINEDASCPTSDREALAADVVALIHSDTKDREIIISSFDLDVLLEVQTLDPSLYIGYLSLVPVDASDAAESGFAALNVLGGLLDQDDVDDIHALGLDVNVWTIDEAAQMDELFGYGVDMIITDHPDLLEQRREAFCSSFCGVVD